MILSDFHTHTSFCDGENTPEEMVLAAIAKGIKTLGFSGHSHTPFDKDYCMSPEDILKYRDEVLRLKDKYKDKIEILLGIEQDYYSDSSCEGYDYVIGSVHYLEKDGKYYSVDLSEAALLEAAEAFGGINALICAYFETLSRIYEKTHCNIIGHFDLIAKFNGDGKKLFSETDEFYLREAEKAIKKLAPLNIPFEINVGAIHRGYRSIPYPAPEIMKIIKQNSGKVLLSSDSHSTKTLCFEFEKWEKYAKKFGFELN